jgi:outer membrane autotransporter protein
MNQHLRKTALAFSVMAAIFNLSACGGGGGSGNVRPTPATPSPIVTPPTDTPPPVTPPPAPPPPELPPPVDQADFTDINNPTHVPKGFDVHGVWDAPVEVTNNYWVVGSEYTHAEEAHAAGVTGKNVKVEIIDSGLAPDLAQFDPGKVTYKNFNGNVGDDAMDDPDGHGTAVAKVLAGQAYQYFRGGMAPDVSLYVAHGSLTDVTGTSLNSDNMNAALDWGIANDVKIFNASYNDTATLSDADIAAIRAGGTSLGDTSLYEYQIVPLRKVAAADGLLVYSAGNTPAGGLANPTTNAQAPLLFDKYADANSFIVVVANTAITQDEDGVSGTIASWSNRCGNMAYSCMAATGEYILPLNEVQDNGVYGATTWAGTSFAAPTVAGGAALVSQVFPWMTGANLRATLLTTASYHDDGSVTSNPFNATYGWGDLDVIKALNGPSMFYAPFGNFSAALDSGDYTFANAISGGGGLDVTSSGSGVLHLAAENTYTGGTSIASGTLSVDGSITSNTAVSGTGVLTGTGTIKGNVANAGTVLTRAGSLYVNGNYTQSADGVYAVSLGAPLQVSGTAALDGTITVNPLDGAYVVKASENLLHANAGVSGTFATVDTGVFLRGALSYGANSVDGVFTRTSTQSAMSASAIHIQSVDQTAVAMDKTLQVVDSWVTSGQTLTGAQSAFLTRAAAFEHLATVADAAVALQSLNGGVYATANTLTFEGLDLKSHIIDSRLSALDANTAGSGIWVQGAGLDGRIGQDGLVGTAYSLSTGAVGIDTDFDHSALRAGLALTYGKVSSQSPSFEGKVTSDNYGLLAYTRYDLTPRWYVGGSLALDHGKSTTERHVLVDGASALSADTRTNAVRLALETGYRASVGTHTSLTPYAGLSQTHLDVSSFHEVGDDGFGLHAASQVYNRTLARAGLKLDNTMTWDSGWWTTLSAYGEYQLAFNNPDMAFSARYLGVGGEGDAFRIDGAALSRNASWIGAGVAFGKGDRVHYFINADQRFSGHSNAHGFNAGVEVKF